MRENASSVRLTLAAFRYYRKLEHACKSVQLHKRPCLVLLAISCYQFVDVPSTGERLDRSRATDALGRHSDDAGSKSRFLALSAKHMR